MSTDDQMPVPKQKTYFMKFAGHPLIYTVAVPSLYSFEIIDEEGNTVSQFDLTDERIMHLLVVRHDLTNFQHLFPVFDSEMNVFKIENLSFQEEGRYRLLAYFTPKTVLKYSVVTYQDIDVDVSVENDPHIEGDIESIKEFEGYEVALGTTADAANPGTDILAFTVKKDKMLVTDLDNYLNGYGFSTVLKSETLEYAHAHFLPPPDGQDGTLNFSVKFPTTGYYKVFTEFKHHGNVITTDFLVNVRS